MTFLLASVIWFIIIFTQDVCRDMVPGDAPERVVRDSIIKGCCKHLLGKGLLLWFHFVGRGGSFKTYMYSMSLGNDISIKLRA